jgi:hypothetical protein
MVSNRRRARRLAVWRAYVRRIDRLVEGQVRPSQPGSPMRVTSGFLRAEGWDTRGIHRREMGHGA